jgi:putative addiction module component (TIGR02574 family)
LTANALWENEYMIAKDIKRLSKSEKILLVQDLWDDISGGSAGIGVKKDEIDYVNSRILEIRSTDEQLISWDDLKATTAAKRKK